MRKTTKTAVLRLDKVTKEYLLLEKKYDKTKAEQRKFNELSDEIEVITKVFGKTFDINLEIKESRLIDKFKEEIEAEKEKLNDKYLAVKEELSKTIEFKQLVVGGQFQKIKNNMALAHLKILDVLKENVLNDIYSTIDFISQNKTEYLKGSVIAEALAIEGAEMLDGTLVIPTDFPSGLKEKLKIYGCNVKFKLM